VQRFIRFLVYKDFFKIKPVGWLLRAMRAIPIAGGNRKEVIESLERAGEELRQGHVVCIFAEGAISRTGNMLPFKKGFEKILKGLDVPIIPVHLDRLWGSIFSFEKGRFFWKWPRRIPYPVTVSFGAPLPSTATAQEVRQAVMTLGSEAVPIRRKKEDLLHLKFISSAKGAWRRFCMADSTGKELTYGKALIGSLLLSRKIRRECSGQEMVGIMLPASVGGALANVAVLMAGKVPVNLNFSAGKEAVDAAIRQCGIKTILTSSAFIAKAKIERRAEMIFLEAISKSISPAAKAGTALLSFLLPVRAVQRLFCPEKKESDHLATVIFSSGSTGEPKGVMLSHHNILSNIESFSQVFWVTERDRVMGVLPFFHSFGFTGTLWFPLIARFGAVYHPNPMDAKVIGEMVSQHQATILISTPTFYGGYIRRCSKEEFRSLRYAIVGAEKLRGEVAEAFRQKYDLDLLEGYGCTELSPVVAVNVPDVTHGPEHQKGSSSGTVGHPVPGVAVRVIDPDTGETLPAGREGLLLVKGPNLMLGYLGQPEKTASAVKDGWYQTGDIACIDENGFIRITDRLSRFSKIGGEMVPHLKIEEAVNAILQNGSGAVTAIPDDQKGERLVIFFTDSSLCPEELWNRLNDSGLPKLWTPKRENLYLIDALPILGTGKLDLRSLKGMAMERAACARIDR
ncbi:MAG TPA: AMP-binding protein, partial [Candidatus Manganitrophaceae bacterium]|nr:AMP-binding protein [Candidatus Manganitrophaceae bacterium]